MSRTERYNIEEGRIASIFAVTIAKKHTPVFWCVYIYLFMSHVQDQLLTNGRNVQKVRVLYNARRKKIHTSREPIDLNGFLIQTRPSVLSFLWFFVCLFVCFSFLECVSVYLLGKTYKNVWRMRHLWYYETLKCSVFFFFLIYE